MIIVTTTTPSVINTTVAPVVDAAANLAMAGTTTPSDAFSSTLNTQLGLVSPTMTDATTLASSQAALLATTSVIDSAINSTINTMTTTLTTQQPAVLTDASVQNSPLLTSTMSPAIAAMTEEDSAILSNVNDTLKFIATGSTLGDTLSAGQSVQLPSANLTTPLTQETVQSAVQQVVTNAQVNTPAAFLAQQATPVQVSDTPVETPNTNAEQVVVLPQVQNAVTTQSQPTEKIVVSTPAQAETNEQPVVTIQAQEAQVQTPAVQAQTETAEQPLMAQVQTPAVKMETDKTEQPLATPAQVQTATTEQPVEITQAQVQTPVQAKIETTEQPVETTQVQVQTPTVQTQTAQAQTATTQAQTATTQVPVLVTQAKAESSEKSVSTQQTAQAQTPIAQAQVQTAVQPVVVAQAQRVMTEQAGTPLQAIVSPTVQKTVNKEADKVTDENTQPDPTLLAQISTQTVVQNNVVEEKAAKQDAKEVGKTETSKTDNQDAPPVQVTTQNVAPLVTAQATPIQVKADAPTFETPASSSAPEDKLSLTPAKNLLADVLANRSNGGDTAANSGDKKGSDTPSNFVSQMDNSLNSATDLGKQNTDTKSFASLLSADKSDVATATQATSTGDKTAPQVMAAVNKLADNVKTEVPALTRPLTHPDWNQEVGDRIVWMNNRGISSAEIRMNPQNMGPITVRIDMNQDQATIAFTAQNADVRTALEASIPKLREMLSSQNVNLADVNVSQQSSTSADSGRSQQQAAQMAADASANGQGGNRQNQEIDVNGNLVSSGNANGEDVAVDEFANGQVLSDNGANGLLNLFA